MDKTPWPWPLAGLSGASPEAWVYAHSQITREKVETRGVANTPRSDRRSLTLAALPILMKRRFRTSADMKVGPRGLSESGRQGEGTDTHGSRETAADTARRSVLVILRPNRRSRRADQCIQTRRIAAVGSARERRRPRPPR